MESDKNLLQEYYQKRSFSALPHYEHERTPDGWKVTLTLPCGTSGPYQAVGRNKKQADQQAAKMALEALYGVEKTPQPLTLGSYMPPPRAIDPGSFWVLIDLENSPQYDPSNCRAFTDNVRFEAFVGKLSSHASKPLEQLYPFIDRLAFHIIDSGHQDAVDHAISVRAGEWLAYLREWDGRCNIMIVSRDRFACALVDILRQHSQHQTIGGVFHVTTIEDAFNQLEKCAKGAEN